MRPTQCLVGRLCTGGNCRSDLLCFDTAKQKGGHNIMAGAGQVRVGFGHDMRDARLRPEMSPEACDTSYGLSRPRRGVYLAKIKSDMVGTNGSLGVRIIPKQLYLLRLI